jgi:hypothetical protein
MGQSYIIVFIEVANFRRAVTPDNLRQRPSLPRPTGNKTSRHPWDVKPALKHTAPDIIAPTLARSAA